MHVLFVPPFLPWPLLTGSHHRYLHLARGVAQSNEVTVVTGPAPDPARQREWETAFLNATGCARVLTTSIDDRPGSRKEGAGQWGPLLPYLWSLLTSKQPSTVESLWSRSLVELLARQRSERKVDVVLAGRLWMGEQVHAAGFEKIALDVDDVLSEATRSTLKVAGRYRRRPFHEMELVKIRRYEQKLPARFSRLFVCKEEDRALFPAREEGRARVRVVPNGVDVPTALDPSHEAAATILFVGTLGYDPNADAVAFFHSEVLPLIKARRPDVRFVVAGRAYPRGRDMLERIYAPIAADSSCTLVESPEEVRPFYEDATLVVTPIRVGGGTRIKVLEALAYGKALVSTTFAAEGIHLRTNVDVLFADTPEAQADACMALIDNADRRRALGTAGRGRIESEYAWPIIERLVAEECERLASEAAPHPSASG